MVRISTVRSYVLLRHSYVILSKLWARLTSEAGCGKSVLSSSIVDSLGSTENVVYYYCDYSDKRTLDPANLFGTLAR